MTFMLKSRSQRQLRVGMEVRGQLSRLLPPVLQWVPELQNLHLTVLDVRMSPDLRHATVFISVLGQAPSDLLQRLQAYTPQIRKRLAANWVGKFLPVLVFRYPDPAASRLEELLQTIRQSS